MKLHYIPIGLVVLAGLARPGFAGPWDGSQYFARGFQCNLVPEKVKQDEDDDSGPGFAGGRIECYGKKMRMETRHEAPRGANKPHGKPEHKGKPRPSGAEMFSNMVIIMDPDAHKSIWLVPEKKIYIETDVEKSMGKQQRHDEMFSRRAELQELGRETIDGHACRKVRPTWLDEKGNKEKSDEILWLASDLRDFPVQSMDEKSGDIVHYRDIKFGPVPASRFQVPAGYAKSDFGELIGSKMKPGDQAKMDEAMKMAKDKMNSSGGKEAAEKLKGFMQKPGGGSGDGK